MRKKCLENDEKSFSFFMSFSQPSEALFSSFLCFKGNLSKNQKRLKNKAFSKRFFICITIFASQNLSNGFHLKKFLLIVFSIKNVVLY